MIFPALTATDPVIEQAYRMAVGDLIGNIIPFKDGLLEREAPAIMAGLDYNTPWTRDTAINTWNGAGLLRRRCRGLPGCVCGKRRDQRDTGVGRGEPGTGVQDRRGHSHACAFHQLPVLSCLCFGRQHGAGVESSCPGSGLIMTMGSPLARHSAVVIPPGFVTIRCAASMSSSTLLA